MSPYTIRRATEEDVPTVVSLWTEASRWLGEQGSDQWQYPVKMHYVRAAIAARTCWIVDRADGEPVATVTLDEDADPDLWRPEDEPDQALYLHRLVVRLDERGNELGSAILDWATRRAQAAGKKWLRLDAWTGNEQLHRYYLDRAFHLVRVVANPATPSGALLQRVTSYAESRESSATERDRQQLLDAARVTITNDPE